MLRHSVLFTLHHPSHSSRETEFLKAAEHLRQIPGVTQFEIHRQISRKNPFAFGISMEFRDTADFENYLSHPLHSEFVASRWVPEVKDFLEIDLASIADPARP
ncbi:MAG: hypothetical protein RLZZ399_1739 [Verrucomicrobiota bacterium]|jgi:quinol monooxygenase YgiN